MNSLLLNLIVLIRLILVQFIYSNVIDKLNIIAEFSLLGEAGDPFFWGESMYMEGQTLSPNPSANLVSVLRGFVYFGL